MTIDDILTLLDHGLEHRMKLNEDNIINHKDLLITLWTYSETAFKT